jgi:ferritin-like metal-binding protein YciE
MSVVADTEKRLARRTTMSMETLEDLLLDQLKDIYNAEQQLVKALPRIARASNHGTLREAIENHLQETEGQVERLEQISQQLGVSLRGKKCKGMEGLIEEGKEVLQEDGPEPVLDAGIIAAAQKVEHYEICAYGTARTLAEQLGLSDVATLLEESLEEEKAADEKLTEISEGTILPEAQNLEGAEEDEDSEEYETEEEEAEPSRGRGRNGARRAAPSRRGARARA